MPDARRAKSATRSPPKTRCVWQSTMAGSTAPPTASTIGAPSALAGAWSAGPIHATRPVLRVQSRAFEPPDAGSVLAREADLGGTADEEAGTGLFDHAPCLRPRPSGSRLALCDSSRRASSSPRSCGTARIWRASPSTRTAGAAIDDLLAGVADLGVTLTHEELMEIVDTNNKRRFRVSDDGRRIRASQGHTIEVDLGYRPAEPPELLFHGTAEKNLPSIRAEGLDRMRRTHVHLSEDPKTARDVGMRYGKPVVLKVEARRMYEDGMAFFLADNGVWLTEAVPWAYILGGGPAE